MRVKEFSAAVKLASMVSNNYSMAPAFRGIQLFRDEVFCHSECGKIIVKIEDSNLSEKCLISSSALNAVLNSLPENGDIQFELKDSLLWKCGTSKGSLSKIFSETPILTIDRHHEAYPWLPNKTVAEALVLASAACQQASVSIGAYGVVLYNREGKLQIMSSNSASLAEATLPSKDYPPIDCITVRPPIPNTLAAIIKYCEPEIAVDVTSDGIFVLGKDVMAELSLSLPLSVDLFAVSGKYTERKHVTKVKSEEIRKFLVRANALVDKHDATVMLGVEAGQIKLEHKGVAGSSEEYFLADGLDPSISFTGVQLPIYLVATALRGIDSVVLDYLTDKVLVLTGSSPEFKYVISGS